MNMRTNDETFERALINAVNDNTIIFESASIDCNGILTLTINIGRPSQELINTITSKANQFDFRSV
jgi:hypothetical protein